MGFEIENGVLKKYTAEEGVTELVIPDCVTRIESGAFSGCSSLTSITIPDCVTSIESFAFSGCSSLTSITIPDGVTSISSRTFSGCSSLTSITIPDGVTRIESDAFSGCSSLTDILVNDANANYRSVDGMLFDKSGAKLICCPDGKSGAITIPDGVTRIESDAFSGCSSLTSITIPDGVTVIGDYVFRNCSNLTSITIPDGVTSIEYGTFSGCSSLTSITIPNSVTGIWDGAFEGCTGLTSVAIPHSVTDIGWSVFADAGLTSIKIPDSVTSIKYGTFERCTKLTSVAIPNSVTSIGNYAFKGCTGLTSITIPDGVTSIGYQAFYDCTKLTSVTIPDSMTYIWDEAFAWCQNLKFVALPEWPNTLTIYSNAFSASTVLKMKLSDPTDVLNLEYDVPLFLHIGEKIRVVYCKNKNRDVNLQGFGTEDFNWIQYDLNIINNGPKFKMGANYRLLAALYRMLEPDDMADETKECYIEYLTKNIKKVIPLAEMENEPAIVQLLFDIGAINDKNRKAVMKLIAASENPEIAALAKMN